MAVEKWHRHEWVDKKVGNEYKMSIDGEGIEIIEHDAVHKECDNPDCEVKRHLVGQHRLKPTRKLSIPWEKLDVEWEDVD